MRHLKDGMVDLTITSPPYWNAVDYDAHIKGSGVLNYRTRKNLSSYAGYLRWLSKCFVEVARVTKIGSMCAAIVGTLLDKGKHIPLPFHFVTMMEATGKWRFHQDIIWAKCTAGIKRFRVTVQHPYPGYYYPNIMTEYIMVFQRIENSACDRKLYDSKSDQDKSEHEVELDSVTTKDVANNIWHIAPVPPNTIDHPCPFPEEIPFRLIRWYTYKGDIVLDPFCGSGTVLKVANAMDRVYIGYDTELKYAEMSRARVNEEMKLRKQLIVSYDKVAYGERHAKGKNPG